MSRVEVLTALSRAMYETDGTADALCLSCWNKCWGVPLGMDDQ